MSSQEQISELSRRHRMIDRQIEVERERRAPDLVKLGELKRKKLHLKDEMARLGH